MTKNGMIIADLIDARILTELHKTGSFAGAARALRLPSTTVSRRVARMEDRTGLRLFERTSRRVQITEAGEVAARHAAQMLVEAETAEVSLDHLRGKPSGIVAVSTPVIFGQSILAPVAAQFLKQYPDCALEIDLSDQHVNLIEDRFDVVVRIGPPESEEIIAKHLGVVFAGLYRAASAPKPQNVKDLREAPLGLLHPGAAPTPELHLTSVKGAEKTLAASPALVAMNPWLLRDAAIESDLIVVLPDIVAAPAVTEGQLVRVLPDWYARRAPVHLAFTSRRFMRPAVRAFVDHAFATIPPRLKV
ncbi:MAG: LysR family transcriptional regulator [Pseudomonadota bacterium]